MAEVAKQENVKEVLVRTTDGAVWQAEIKEGVTYLVKQIQPPSTTASGENESSPPSSGDSKETETEEKPASSQEEENQEEGIFESLEPNNTVDEFLKEMEAQLQKNAQGHGSSHKMVPRPDQPKVVEEMPESVKKNMKDNAFKARLSSVMLDNKYDRMLKGRTRGKLDMSRLYKVPTQARTVFKQKQSRRGKQYNVLLLVDESGSMLGSKAENAAECAVFLAKNFEGININVAIIGFNHYITVRKEFTGPADYDRIYEAIETCNWRNGAGDNNDYDALLRAYKMFDTAPDGQNVLLMLSDGRPAPSYQPEFIDIRGHREDANKYRHKLSRGQTEEKKHLHHLVNAYKERVTSVGIGIRSGGWQIPEHFVIDDVHELKTKIIQVLNKKIKRG